MFLSLKASSFVTLPRSTMASSSRAMSWRGAPCWAAGHPASLSSWASPQWKETVPWRWWRFSLAVSPTKHHSCGLRCGNQKRFQWNPYHLSIFISLIKKRLRCPVVDGQSSPWRPQVWCLKMQWPYCPWWRFGSPKVSRCLQGFMVSASGGEMFGGAHGIPDPWVSHKRTITIWNPRLQGAAMQRHVCMCMYIYIYTYTHRMI